MALWLAVVGLLVLTLGLSQRLVALERARAAPETPPLDLLGAIPRVGEPLPDLLSGGRIVYRPATVGRTQILLFLSSTCAPCRELAASLHGARRERRRELEGIELVVITDAVGAFVYQDGTDRLLVQSDSEISKQVGVKATPTAISLDRAGRVCGVGLPGSVEDVARLAGTCISERPLAVVRSEPLAAPVGGARVHLPRRRRR